MSHTGRGADERSRPAGTLTSLRAELADAPPGEWFWTLLNGEAAVVREISKAVSARGREFPK